MNTTLKPLAALHCLYTGYWFGYPLAAPKFVSFGESYDDVVVELQLFLSEYLNQVGPDYYADFEVTPEERAVLVDVNAEIKREDITTNALISTFQLRVPTVLVEERWAKILPFQQTVYLDSTDFEAQQLEIETRVQRYLTALAPEPGHLLRYFPAAKVELVTLEIDLDRLASINKDKRSKKELSKEEKRNSAIRLLREVGKEVRKEELPKRIGHQRAVEGLAALIGGKERLSCVVIGASGQGKSAVLREALRSREYVYQTSGAQLIAGQSFFGQWQQRVHDVMAAAEQLDAVVWFDDLSDLFSAKGGSRGMASVMRQYLDDKRVRIAGELRPDDVDRAAASDYGFYQNLHPFRLDVIDAEESVEILKERQIFHARRDDQPVRFDDDALETIVELVNRYHPYDAAPGKAVSMYEAIRTSHDDPSFAYDAEAKTKTLKRRSVYEQFSAASGVPMFLLQKEKPLEAETVVDFFRQRIIGQSLAVRRVAETICSVKAQLQSDTKPLANFLFIGPTGVGKTEVARTLARYLFGSEDRMIRFDMSEYTTPASAERLIRGTDYDDGLLTRAIRKQPFSVVLLDEIEKADSSVFDLLLQVLGEGRLSDARGRVSYFNNAIVIMTSNLGAATRGDNIGFSGGDSTSESYYIERVESHFRPEFVNRLDRIVAFHALSPDDIREVTEIAIDRMSRRHGFAERGIELRVTDAARTRIATDGHSDLYGARYLKRYLDKNVVSPISKMLAATGSDAYDTNISVQTDGEDRASGALTSSVLHPYTFDLFRSGPSVSRIVRSVDDISKIRREVERVVRTHGLTSLRDQETFLTARIFTLTKAEEREIRDANRRGEEHRWNPEIGHLSVERDATRKILEGLGGARETIAEIEEFAILASLRGDDFSEFQSALGEELSLFYRWAARGLLFDQRSWDHLVIGLVEPDDHTRTMERVLEPFLEECVKREWLLSGFAVDEGIFLSQEQLGSWVRKRERSNGLLLSVDGEYAGALLAVERGLFEFNRGNDSEYLMFRVMSFLHTLEFVADAKHRDEYFKIANNVDLKRMPKRRQYSDQTNKLVINGSRLRTLDFQKEYYPRLEEIVSLDLLSQDVIGVEHFHSGFDMSSFGDVMALAKDGQKIQAIKLYRTLTGCGLKEAKESVEQMMGEI